MSGRWIITLTALSLATLLAVGILAVGLAEKPLQTTAPENTLVLVPNGVQAPEPDAEQRAVEGPHGWAHPSRPITPPVRAVTTDKVSAASASERNRATSALASRGLSSGRPLYASWYGEAFQGLETASGEKFDKGALTAAHRNLPFGTRLLVTNLANGRVVEVRVNDRGPWVAGRELDLSETAFRQLAPLNAGVIPVRVEIVNQ